MNQLVIRCSLLRNCQASCKPALPGPFDSATANTNRQDVNGHCQHSALGSAGQYGKAAKEVWQQQVCQSHRMQRSLTVAHICKAALGTLQQLHLATVQ